jgi:glutaredoxin
MGVIDQLQKLGGKTQHAAKEGWLETKASARLVKERVKVEAPHKLRRFGSFVSNAAKGPSMAEQSQRLAFEERQLQLEERRLRLQHRQRGLIAQQREHSSFPIISIGGKGRKGGRTLWD